MSDLDKLIEAIRGARHTRTRIEEMACQVFGLCQTAMNISAAYGMDDLNAARNLHIELTPGIFWVSFVGSTATIISGQEEYTGRPARTAARSWVLAVLKAYRDRLKQPGEAAP